MSAADGWSRQLGQKAAEKVADSFVAWLVSLVATSGLVVAAKAFLHERAPVISAYVVAVGPWAVAAMFALLFVLAGFRARTLKRELASLEAWQERGIAQAAARARDQLAAELRAQWTEEAALESFGLEPTDAWCFVYETESTWALHMTVRAWSAIPYPTTITVVEATFALDDGRKELASLNPHVSWSPLSVGLNETVRLSVPLSQRAAELIRVASVAGCVMLTALVRVSLSLDGGPPTNPDRYRRKLEHPLRIQK